MSRRRALLTAGVVVAVVAMLAVLPALPPVRGYLVGRVVDVLRDGGTHVDFARSAGNAWRGITLEDAEVLGTGIDVQAQRVRVGYFLPSLLGGELPLDVQVSGARGSVDLSQFLSDVAAGPAGPSGPISVQLRRLTLEDVEVAVQEAPFTLPDATISQLEVDQNGTVLDLEGTVTTADGEARVAGRFETITGTFEGNLVRADATIARHWWPGIESGELSGDVGIRGGLITGNFTLNGATIDDIGLVATDVSGDIELDYPVITAEVTGNALGGPITAAGVVNVEAELWEAEAQGDVALEEAAAWLLRENYPDGPPVDVTGRADVALNLRGWDHLALDGNASGSGQVAGLPLDELSTSFRLPRDGRVRAEGTGTLGGGPLSFEMGPGTAGERLLVTASSVDLDGFQEGLGSADARLRLAMDGRDDGELSVEWSGSLAGRVATARMDARLDPDGWQGFVTGSDSTGAELEGALVLADGRVDGGLSLGSLGLPGVPESTRLALGVSGPADLEGARLTLSVDADAPLTPDLLEDGPDLRGSLAGTYRDGAVSGIVGRFGPVGVSGFLDLAPLTLTADLLMEPTRLALAGGGVSAGLTVPRSAVVLGPSGLDWSGQVTYTSVQAGPATTPDGTLGAQLRASFDDPSDPWSLTGRSGSQDLVVDAGPSGIYVELDGLPLALAGATEERPALSGALSGEIDGTSLDLTVSPTAGGQVELPADLQLAGAVVPETSSLSLSGTLGDLPVLFTADWSGPLSAVAEVDPNGERTLFVTYDAESQAVGLTGGADLGRVLQLVTQAEAPMVAATLTIDMRGTLAGGTVTDLRGNGAVVVRDPVDVTTELTGQGDSIAIDVTGEAGGMPVNGTGSLDLADLGGDEPLLTVDVGPLVGLEVRPGGIRGAGELEGLDLGPLAVPDLPWSFQATWSDDVTGSVSVAGSSVDLALDGDELVVSGPVTLPARYAGEEIVATVSVPGGRVPLANVAGVELDASLSTVDDEPLLSARGPLDRLDLAGELPLSLLAAPLPEDARPTGSLAVAGRVNALRGELQLRVGDDVSVTLQDGALRVAADEADLTPYLPGQAPTGLHVSVDGVLMTDQATGWNGGLRADLSLPGEEPMAATVMLTGSGAVLTTAVSASGPFQATLEAEGQLYPQLELTGALSALGGAVTADLAVDPESGFVATVRSTELVGHPYFTVPPLQAALTLAPDEPGPRLTGSWITAAVDEDGDLTGEIDLPFTLLSEPARLRADLAGTPLDPRATVELTGAGVLVNAEGDTSSASATLTLTEPALTAALPTGAADIAAFVTSPVVADARWDSSAGWTLDASATAEPPGAPVVALGLSLEGVGAAYDGVLSAYLPSENEADPVLSAQVSGNADDLNATVDLATVDYRTLGAAFDADVEMDGNGLVRLGTVPTTFDVDVDLAGTVEGADVTLQGSVPDDLRFTLTADQVNVSGRLAWNEERRLVVSGEAAGRPVDAWLELDDDLESGRLHVDVPSARLEALLATQPSGVRTASVSGQLTGDGVAGFAGDFTAQVVLDGDRVDVTQLQADVMSVPGLGDELPLTIQGSGSLTPEVTLAGTLGSPAASQDVQDGTWSLGGAPLEASVEWLGLEVVYGFGPGEVTVTAPGDVAPALAVLAPDLEGLELLVDGPGLTWNPDSGFAGLLNLEAIGDIVPEQARPARMELSGRGGDLQLELAAGTTADGSPLAHVAATLPAQALASGRLDADVQVSGEFDAAGQLRFAGGEAELGLTGEGLIATARLGAAGWSVDARLDRLPVGDVLPQLDSPTVSLSLTGSSGTGVIAVEDILVESGQSRLTGSASLDGRVRAALRAQLDLADLDIGGTELRGVVRGPVVVVAPSVAQILDASVTAQLDAAGVGLVGVPAMVDGAVQVGGTLTDPVVYAQLVGREQLRGSLRLEAAPARGRFDLRSNLAYADVTTDMRVSVGTNEVVASGSIRAGDAILLIEDSGGGLQLTGAGRLDGWSATVAQGLTELSAEGPLSGLAPGVSGSATVRLGSSGDGPWLQASVEGLEAAGQALGDLELTSASAGAPIDLTGEGIVGTIDPMDQSWSLSVSDFALPADIALSVDAQGQGIAGEASVRATGGSALELDVDVELSLASDGTSLEASGSLLGGELSLAGQRDGTGAWTGQVELIGAGLPAGDPTAALVATGVLQGNQALPQAVLGTAIYASGAGAAAAGRVTAGPSGLTLDQSIALPTVSAPLRVQGRIAPGLDLTFVGAGDQPGQPRGQVRIREVPSGLTAAGALVVPVGPVVAELGSGGDSRSPRLRVSPAAVPEAELIVDLGASDLGALVSRITRDGLVVAGTGAAAGGAVLTLAPEVELELRGLGLSVSGFGLELSGPLTLSEADLTGTLTLPITPEDEALATLPLTVTGSEGAWRLASQGPLGTVDAAYDTVESRALVDVALRVPGSVGEGVAGQVTGGAVTARLAYDPVSGPTGTLSLNGVSLEPPAWGELTVAAEATLADGRIGGAATLQSQAGSISVTGDAPLSLIAPGMAVDGEADDGDLQVRLRAVELSEVPVVASVAPHLSGAVSGVVQVRDGFVLGQVLAPELAVGETALPITAQVSGPLSNMDLALVTGGSLVSLSLADMTLSGLARFERFPLDLLAEAVVGPSDVSTFLTGVARIDLPLGDPGTGYAALASEELVLERAGVVTHGELTLTYDDGALRVDRATFSGRGEWRASGVLAPDDLDFELVAEEADFGPLLGLFPALAQYGVGAEGSFAFRATGDLSQPLVTFEADDLGVQVAGTRYLLEDTDIRLEGPELSADMTLRSLAPVTGALHVTAQADVTLDPVALRAVDVGFEGDLAVPGVGRVEGVHGTITQDPQFRPFLALAGELGSPFSVQGTLVPLDLRAGGTDLRISYPGLLIADATVAADLRLRSEEGGVALSGVIRAQEVVLDPAASGADATSATSETAATSEAGESADQEPAAPGADVVAEQPTTQGAEEQPSTQETEDPLATSIPTDGVPPSPVRPSEPEPEPDRNALAALRFDDLRITAPQRVVLTTSFSSLEAALDLTLSGTGAEPRLTGQASTIRGNLRFAGREFTLDQAIGTFSANRGVLPELDVRAHTEFEKTRVLTGNSDVSFAAPDGRTFRVDLAFRGPVERTDEGEVRFDVDPALSSDALIEVAVDPEAPAAPAGGGVRPLTEAELLTLVTLGRLELGSDLIGAGGLGGAVAQGALDTAVDVLLLGEFQNAIREALGLDVFEIRTSAFSRLLDANGDPFGVSVRLGGYLNPELFASYTIGTADPDDPGFAVTNEVALEYALGPLDLEISGRLDFPMSGVLAGPRSELGVGLAYQLGGTVGLDLSTSLSTDRSAVSFGVTFRW